MRYDILITKLNETFLYIEAERSILKELRDYFSFHRPNYQLDPRFQRGLWDGYVKLFKPVEQTLYVGLLPYLREFIKREGYSYAFTEKFTTRDDVTLEQVKKFTKQGLNPYYDGKKITPYEHQDDAVFRAIRNRRALLLSPTGSGKSLIIYALVRYYLKRLKKDQKILLVVPTTSLVEQMYGDFENYAHGQWDVDANCHRIYSGKEKTTKKRVIITTWQSVYNKRKNWFKNFGALIGDECHHYQADSLRAIASKCENAKYRVGTTGSLDGTDCHKLMIEGLFGLTEEIAKTKDLIDKGILSKLMIHCPVLRYPEKDRKELRRLVNKAARENPRKRYHTQLDYILAHEKRLDIVTDIAQRLKGNSLLLFRLVDKHGRPLFEKIKAMCKKEKRKHFFVWGGTDVEQREAIRAIAERETDAVILASFGTFSTGINIKNLHNIVFASPCKGRIRVVQSIGRGLRKSESKDKMNLIDIVDDLNYKDFKCFAIDHFLNRCDIYMKEEFPFKQVNVHI